MLSSILFFLFGLVLIVVGGNFVTDGASAVARRLGVSNLVIGLTVVAFGSSAPDFVVCLTSTLQGKSELALGDVVGSNICDILLVVGVVAMITPVVFSRQMRYSDLAMLALSSCALFICGDDMLFDGTANFVSRTDGLLLLAFFVIFIAYTLRSARNNTPAPAGTATPAKPSPYDRPAIAAGAVIVGLAILVVGGNWIVKGASDIALRAGIPEGIVGLTIVAFGSAAPDLATSLIAAIKNHPGIAIGNVVGSCIFNVFFIIGFCSTIKPLDSGTISVLDYGTLAGGAVVLWLVGLLSREGKMGRVAGAVFTLAYFAYMFMLVKGSL